MAVFTPPTASPPIMELSAPRYGQVPTRVQSHGYDYNVTGNTLLPPVLIEATIDQAKTPKAAIRDLLKAYHASGHMLVAVTARVRDKRVEVGVVEGMITARQIPEPIVPFFPDTLNRRDLRNKTLLKDQVLATAYAARSGHKLTINLGPAPNPGGSILTVNQEPIANYSPVSGVINFGNYGSRYASGYVAGGQIAGNLTHGITITADFTQGLPGLRRVSLGSNYYENGIGISVVRPYGIYGFSATWTHFRLGKSTYPLNPDGNVFSYQFTGSQLLYADNATRLSLNEGFHHVRYDETVFNGFFTLLNQHYDYLSSGLSVTDGLTLGGRAGSLSGDIGFNLGVSAPYGTLYDHRLGAPTPHFRYTVLSLGYQQALPFGTSLGLNGHAQWSPETLPSQQQWVLGGFGNLAAWEPGTIVGDSGYAARLQLNLPSVTRLGSTAQAGAFIETGGATSANPAPGTSPWQSLTDVGLTLTLSLPDKFSAKVMTAVPIERRGYSVVGRQTLALDRLNAFFVIQKGF